VLSPLSATQRLVAIAASGAIHAMVLASLASPTPGEGRAATETEKLVLVETEEQAPIPAVVAPPIEPVSNEAREAHPRPRQQAAARLAPSHPHDPRPSALGRAAARETAPDEAAVPDLPARFLATAPPLTDLPVARDEGDLRRASATSGGETAVVGASDETTYDEGDVTTPATLLSHVDATYPREAWSSGIEADVPVEIVVDARGSVVRARVVAGAGHGFDDAALASIKSYRFAAARRDGRAVPVRVRWSVQFRLRR